MSLNFGNNVFNDNFLTKNNVPTYNIINFTDDTEYNANLENPIGSWVDIATYDYFAADSENNSLLILDISAQVKQTPDYASVSFRVVVEGEDSGDATISMGSTGGDTNWHTKNGTGSILGSLFNNQKYRIKIQGYSSTGTSPDTTGYVKNVNASIHLLNIQEREE